MTDGALDPTLPATPGAATTTFGPSALLTPANAITVVRLLATPVVIALIMLWGASWFTFVFGGLLALSDGIDGWLARKQGTTRRGRSSTRWPTRSSSSARWSRWWPRGSSGGCPVAVIAVREIAMSVYRSVAGRHGSRSRPATRPSSRPCVQDIAIGMCLAPPLAGHWTLLTPAMWAAALLTVFTGAQYYVDGRRAAAERAAGPTGPGGVA